MKIIGIGGAGMNLLNSMINLGMKGVDLIAVNTDAVALEASKAYTKIQIGKNLTNGLGSNGDPDIGRESAILDKEIIMETLQGSKIVFISAGLGGGTGTGVSPVIAKFCKNAGSKVIAIVSTPFSFEGKQREIKAHDGILALNKIVDTIIVRPNDKIRDRISKDKTIFNMFKKADSEIYYLIKSTIMNF